MTTETETETFNPQSLPYTLIVKRPEHHVAPLPMLHMLMCDLSSKIPNLRFETHGTTRLGHGIDSKTSTDDFHVYAGTEKVGEIWMTNEYRRGEYTKVFCLSSSRIRQGRRGSNSTKKTKHYKIALRESIQAFAPYDMKEIAEKITTATCAAVERVASRAASQLDWSVRSAIYDYTNYVADVLDNGPHDVPTALIAKLGNGWRDKLANHKIADSVKNRCSALDGIAVKLIASGEFVAVDLQSKDVIATSTNAYDLPTEYQDKFAILKMMETDQPIDNIGIKCSEHDTLYFYLMGGDLLAK